MPEETIRIRNATIDDVDLIYTFILQLARYEKLEHEATLTTIDLVNTLFCEQPVASVLIAEDAGNPAGFALYFLSYSTFLAKPGIYLEDLFVVEEKRRRGIGSSLLRQLAKICLENNYGRLEWSVLDWNEPAIKVYEQLGAQAMNEWITYRVDGQDLHDLASA